VPWAKAIVQPIPGFMEYSELENIADNIAGATKTYDLLGGLQIAGNASIKPYDLWGSFIVYSVTHNIDLVAKSWTTSLEFMRAAT
jgi:hypothetical protein